MSKLNKIADGHYRSEDGKVEAVEYNGQFIVNELQGNRYVTVARAKTVAEAQKEAGKVLKSQPEEAPVEENVVVVEPVTAAEVAAAEQEADK